MVQLTGQSTFYFPHYRLMYRQTNNADHEKYFDTAEMQNGGMQTITRVPGRLGLRSEVDLGGPCRPCHTHWFASQNQMLQAYTNPLQSAELHEVLIRSMRSNPIQRRVWEDATILPWSPTSQGGGNWLSFR